MNINNFIRTLDGGDLISTNRKQYSKIKGTTYYTILNELNDNLSVLTLSELKDHLVLIQD